MNDYDLAELFRLMDWMNSCEANGHLWVRNGIGNGTQTVLWGPVECSRCGAALEKGGE